MPGPATTPRAFSSVRRKTGDSAELVMPPHRSGPNHRLGLGWWAVVVVQSAGVLHGAFSAAPRSGRRVTRNARPGHDPTCLLGSEEDGGLSRTGHAPAQERAEPSIQTGLVGCGGGSVRWCAARCVLGDTPSGRRVTRNAQPSHHLKNLLVGEEEGGGVSSTARPRGCEGHETWSWSTPSGRRATRSTQPSHRLKNLLVGEEEGGGVSSTACPSEGEGHETWSWSTPSGRRATRNDQPSHRLKNLLVGEEEGGGVSSTARPRGCEGHETQCSPLGSLSPDLFSVRLRSGALG